MTNGVVSVPDEYTTRTMSPVKQIIEFVFYRILQNRVKTKDPAAKCYLQWELNKGL